MKPNQPLQPRLFRASPLVRIWCGPEMKPEEALALTRERGETLSNSRKACVERVGEWVIKRSRFQSGAAAVRLTAQRERARRGMRASTVLPAHGIGVPVFGAYVEWHAGPLIVENALISKYQRDAVTIREFALQLRDGPQETARGFFDALSAAVLRLYDAKAFHSDLADKNVLTVDGSSFVFVDLESVELGRSASAHQRMRNLVQLLDAFYDVWSWPELIPFVDRMRPEGTDSGEWADNVQRALIERIRTRDAFQRLALRRAERLFGPLPDARESQGHRGHPEEAKYR